MDVYLTVFEMLTHLTRK